MKLTLGYPDDPESKKGRIVTLPGAHNMGP